VSVPFARRRWRSTDRFSSLAAAAAAAATAAANAADRIDRPSLDRHPSLRANRVSIGPVAASGAAGRLLRLDAAAANSGEGETVAVIGRARVTDLTADCMAKLIFLVFKSRRLNDKAGRYEDCHSQYTYVFAARDFPLRLYFSNGAQKRSLIYISTCNGNRRLSHIST
jgi:hypothetical protein